MSSQSTSRDTPCDIDIVRVWIQTGNLKTQDIPHRNPPAVNCTCFRCIPCMNWNLQVQIFLRHTTCTQRAMSRPSELKSFHFGITDTRICLPCLRTQKTSPSHTVCTHSPVRCWTIPLLDRDCTLQLPLMKRIQQSRPHKRMLLSERNGQLHMIDTLRPLIQTNTDQHCKSCIKMTQSRNSFQPCTRCNLLPFPLRTSQPGTGGKLWQRSKSSFLECMQHKSTLLNPQKNVLHCIRCTCSVQSLMQNCLPHNFRTQPP